MIEIEVKLTQMIRLMMLKWRRKSAYDRICKTPGELDLMMMMMIMEMMEMMLM